MPLFRVLPGARLSRHGEVLEEGTVVELEPHVAAEMNIRSVVEPVQPGELALVAPPPPTLKAVRPIRPMPSDSSVAVGKE